MADVQPYPGAEVTVPLIEAPTPEVAEAPVSIDRWDTKMRSFRIRLVRFDRPESRMLTVRANNEAGARAQARSRAGREWRIARIEAL